MCDDGNGTVYAHSVPLAAGSSVLRKLLWKASALTPKSTEDKAAKPTSSYSETVQLGEAFECPICNERCLGPILQCENGHSFCSRCIIKWVENNHNCAMCRVDISSPSKVYSQLNALQSFTTISSQVLIISPNFAIAVDS